MANAVVRILAHRIAGGLLLFALLGLTFIGLSQSADHRTLASRGLRFPIAVDHRTVSERWSPNVFAALQLYTLDGEYNKNCLGHLMAVGGAIKSLKMWAIKMVDAFGKPGSYVLRGNTMWQGSYSTCYEVVPDKDAGVDFKPAYCWVTIQLENLPKIISNPTDGSFPPIKTAVCMPDSCSGEELSRIFLQLPEILNLPFYTEHINVTGVQCEVPKPTILEDSRAFIALCILFGVSVMALLGTAVDYYLHYTGELKEESEENPSDIGSYLLSPFWEIMLAFSIPRNNAIIMNFDVSEDAVPTVNGLRSLFVMWAIVANTYFFSMKITDNALDFLDASEEPLIQILLKFSLGMDGLFFLTGMGVTLYYFKLLDDKHTHYRFISEYVFRIIRHWVPYMVVLLIYFCALGKHMGGGPFWSIIEENTETCQRDWWYSATYINNFFIQTEKQCMRHSWYMALDTQYYLMIPLILLPLARWAPLGFIIAGIVQVASMTITGVLTYTKNLPLMIDLKVDRPDVGKYNDYMDYLYVKPYYHVGASLIGIVCGWTLHKIDFKAELSKLQATIGWLFCALFIYFAMYFNTFGQTDAVYIVLYQMTKEVAFALGLFWILLACVTKNGGFVNWLLNLPFWNPMGRMSYCAFLVHGGWILISFLNTEIPKHFSYTLLNCYAVSNVVICYIFAYVLCLFFEAPLVNLKSYFIKGCPVYKRLT